MKTSDRLKQLREQQGELRKSKAQTSKALDDALTRFGGVPELSTRRITRTSPGPSFPKEHVTIDGIPLKPITTPHGPSYEEVLRSHNGEHVYLSTACAHDKHAQCRRQCKFCPAECICECHGKVEVVTAKASDNIRPKSKWPKKKKKPSPTNS